MGRSVDHVTTRGNDPTWRDHWYAQKGASLIESVTGHVTRLCCLLHHNPAAAQGNSSRLEQINDKHAHTSSEHLSPSHKLVQLNQDKIVRNLSHESSQMAAWILHGPHFVMHDTDNQALMGTSRHWLVSPPL